MHGFRTGTANTVDLNEKNRNPGLSKGLKSTQLVPSGKKSDLNKKRIEKTGKV